MRRVGQDMIRYSRDIFWQSALLESYLYTCPDPNAT